MFLTRRCFVRAASTARWWCRCPMSGAVSILKVHMRKVPLAEDVDARVIARGCPGFSGADLANLVNEAALFAARGNKRAVAMDDMEKAKDKLLMGAERRSMVMSAEEKRLTAYHESGHAIVGRLVPDHDPIHKVSIIPRGRALGVTLFLPEEDRYSLSRRRLESQISSLFGGRIAEELIFGTQAVTTGAANDIQRATEIARNMVTRLGSPRPGAALLLRGGGRGVSRRSHHRAPPGLCRDGPRDRQAGSPHHRPQLSPRPEAAGRQPRQARRHGAGPAPVRDTLSKEQIDDIMAGRPVRDPQDGNGNPKPKTDGGNATQDGGARKQPPIAIGSI